MGYFVDVKGTGLLTRRIAKKLSIAADRCSLRLKSFYSRFAPAAGISNTIFPIGDSPCPAIFCMGRKNSRRFGRLSYASALSV